MKIIKDYFGLTALILIVSGLAFYWFEWRPIDIKKTCNITALRKAREAFISKDELLYPYQYSEVVQIDATYTDSYLKEDYKWSYDLCLINKGINN